MKRKKPIHYYTHRGRRKHSASFLSRISTGIFLPFFLIFLATFLTTGAILIPSSYNVQLGILVGALAASLVRLLIAYVLSILVGIPLALLAEGNHRIESVLLPVYDVLESIPILAFFPVIILFFVRSGLLEGAAIFMLFFTMIWSIVFSAIGGLRVIPKDVKSVGHVFGLSRWQRFTQITLPALFPPIVTGSILALAAGWNIVIVAEALHAYAPTSSHAGDLFGIGSILVNAAGSGDNGAFLGALAVLVIVITVINLFLWQPLLGRAERYKFE